MKRSKTRMALTCCREMSGQTSLCTIDLSSYGRLQAAFLESDGGCQIRCQPALLHVEAWLQSYSLVRCLTAFGTSEAPSAADMARFLGLARSDFFSRYSEPFVWLVWLVGRPCSYSCHLPGEPSRRIKGESSRRIKRRDMRCSPGLSGFE